MEIKTKLVPRTESAYNYPLLIKHILAQPLKYEPEKEIVYRDLFRYNYRELHQRVKKLANVLHTLGIKPGDTVAVLDWDSHRYLECFFAIPMIGAILHTVNVKLSPVQTLYTMNHAEDDIVLVHEDFLPLLEGINNDLSTVKKFILLSDKVYEEDTSQAIPSTSLALEGEYENLLQKAPSEYDFPDFDENTWATTFYTTGTTGNPKGVYFSHKQLFLHTVAMALNLSGYESCGGFQSEDIYMPMTPMFHVHAWGIPYIATLLSTKQVYPGRYIPEHLLQLIDREKITFSHCVPTILQMLLNSPSINQIDLSKWKVIIGGSALSKSLAQEALEKKIEIYVGYGMSETCPILALTYLNKEKKEANQKKQLDYRTRAGVMALFADLKIQDESGAMLPHDGKSIGEIIVRAPWLTQGYFKEDIKSEELWKDGWLHTGDIACITPDNFIKITDRAKDVIKTGGEWVSSLELENLINHISGVAEAAVVGMPDEKWGERPYVLVVLKPGYEDKVSSESIKEFLQPWIEKGDITKWYLPNKIAFVQQIPKTSVGKIDKRKIRTEMQDIFKNIVS